MIRSWDISSSLKNTPEEERKVPNVIRSWKGHALPVTWMDFEATGTLLATGSADSTVKVSFFLNLN